MKNMHREHICSRVHVFYFRLIGRQPYIESRQSRDEMAWLEEPEGRRQPVSEMKRRGIELRHGTKI